MPIVVPLVLLALAVAGLGALLRPRWDLALLLGILAAVWSRVNQPVEGRVLVVFNAERGFTEADVLSVLALLLAAVTALRCGYRSLTGARTPARHQGP